MRIENITCLVHGFDVSLGECRRCCEPNGGATNEAMRFFFHLMNGPEIIPDIEGVEVPDASEARKEALNAIAEMRQDPTMDSGVSGSWRLEVVDEAGKTIFSIHVSDPS